MSISKGQLRLSALETKIKRQGCNGLDMCRGGKMDVPDKDVEYGDARQEKKRKNTEKIH